MFKRLKHFFKGKKYYNMTKEELKKSIKLKEGIVSGTNISFLLISTIQLINLLLFTNLVTIITTVGSLLTIGLIDAAIMAINTRKIAKMEKKLKEIITLEYEKERFDLDKKIKKDLSKQKTNNGKLKTLCTSTDEKIRLLEKFKQELIKNNVCDIGKEIQTEKIAMQAEKDAYQYVKKRIRQKTK